MEKGRVGRGTGELRALLLWKGKGAGGDRKKEQ